MRFTDCTLQVIEAMATARNWRTAKQLASATGISHSAVTRHLNLLFDAGWVFRKGCYDYILNTRLLITHPEIREKMPCHIAARYELRQHCRRNRPEPRSQAA